MALCIPILAGMLRMGDMGVPDVRASELTNDSIKEKEERSRMPGN